MIDLAQRNLTLYIEISNTPAKNPPFLTLQLNAFLPLLFALRALLSILFPNTVYSSC